MQVGTAGYDSFTDATLSEGTVLAVGSVDGGANNDDGVLCSFNIFGGNFNCSRNETAEVDRYTGLVEADDAEADVVLEVIDNSGSITSETVSVEVPETPEPISSDREKDVSDVPDETADDVIEGDASGETSPEEAPTPTLPPLPAV